MSAIVSFVAAATVYGGIAPKHLPAHLGPVLDGIAQTLSSRDDYALGTDDVPGVIDNITRAVEAANQAAIVAEHGTDQSAPMILLAVEQRADDPDIVRITYGGGRTYAALLVVVRTGVCSMRVGAYSFATEFAGDAIDVPGILADLAASIERRRAAGSAQDSPPVAGSAQDRVRREMPVDAARRAELARPLSAGETYALYCRAADAHEW